MHGEILINVKVKPKAKKEYVKKVSDNEFEVAVNEPPEEGRANRRVIELLAEYLNVSKSNISIIKGEKSKSKILKVTT